MPPCMTSPWSYVRPPPVSIACPRKFRTRSARNPPIARREQRNCEKDEEAAQADQLADGEAGGEPPQNRIVQGDETAPEHHVGDAADGGIGESIHGRLRAGVTDSAKNLRAMMLQAGCRRRSFPLGEGEEQGGHVDVERAGEATKPAMPYLRRSHDEATS